MSTENSTEPKPQLLTSTNGLDPAASENVEASATQLLTEVPTQEGEDLNEEDEFADGPQAFKSAPPETDEFFPHIENLSTGASTDGFIDGPSAIPIPAAVTTRPKKKKKKYIPKPKIVDGDNSNLTPSQKKMLRSSFSRRTLQTRFGITW